LVRIFCRLAHSMAVLKYIIRSVVRRLGGI